MSINTNSVVIVGRVSAIDSPIQFATVRKQTIAIKTLNEKYPAEVSFELIDELIEKYASSLKIGDCIKVYINLSSKKYAGTWYNNHKAWRIEHIDTDTDE